MGNELCSECGKPSVGKGLCRRCYDKQRLVITINVSKKIRDYVRDLSEDNKWSMTKTIQYLLDGGLKWHRKKLDAKEEFEL